MNDIAVCVKDIAVTTKLSMAMLEPGPRRSAIHAVLFKDTSGNVGHDLTKVLHLLGAEIGGGRRSLLELVLHGNFARIFYSEHILYDAK